MERFGVSIPKELLDKFDQVIKKKGYANRSEALRDLMRDDLVEQSITENKEVIGTITLIYDHHAHALSDRLTDLQHHFYANILSSTHIHLDHKHCLEVLVVRGQSGRVKEISDKLISAKGVKHGKLVMTGREI